MEHNWQFVDPIEYQIIEQFYPQMLKQRPDHPDGTENGKNYQIKLKLSVIAVK